MKDILDDIIILGAYILSAVIVGIIWICIHVFRLKWLIKWISPNFYRYVLNYHD
jgi:hypothetical protein